MCLNCGWTTSRIMRGRCRLTEGWSADWIFDKIDNNEGEDRFTIILKFWYAWSLSKWLTVQEPSIFRCPFILQLINTFHQKLGMIMLLGKHGNLSGTSDFVIDFSTGTPSTWAALKVQYHVYYFASVIMVIKYWSRNSSVTKWKSSRHVLADKLALLALPDVGRKAGLRVFLVLKTQPINTT